MGDHPPTGGGDEGLAMGQSHSHGKIQPQPTTFFDILVEKDVAVRGQKLAAAAQASMNVGDALDEFFPEGIPPSDVVVDPSFNIQPNLAHFLKELAGDVYLDMANIRLSKRLGEGGFAVVHKADMHTAGGTRTVAIKALKPGVIEDDEDMKELIQEANLLRKVNHKYIVAFCGVGSVETHDVAAMRGSVYFAEEFMPGGTLKQLIMKQMKKKLPRKYMLVDALRWCTHIAEALLYLHNSTPVIVHRDLKPENVLLTSTATDTAEAKIADFGLHKRLSKIHMLRKNTQTFTDLLQSREGTEEGSYAKSGGSEAMSGPLMGFVRRLSLKSSGGTRDVETAPLPNIKESEEKRPTNSGQHGSLTSLEVDGAGRKETAKRKKRRKGGGELGNIGSIAGSTATGMAGSLMYMAPEVIRGEKYDEEVDVFGFGIIMYELFRMELTIVRLLASCVTVGEMQGKMNQYAQRVSRGFREQIPQDWPPAISDLIGQCWSQDPKKRPTIGVVLERLSKIASSGVVEDLDVLVDVRLEQEEAAMKCCCVVS